MYIIKNAFRCISRAKARNLLIGIIVFVIAVSSCIGLSIRQAAQSAKEETLKGMSVTATISFDRQSVIEDMRNPQQGGFDRNSFADFMAGSSSLTLEEYEEYAECESVKDFYYTMSVSLNGDGNIIPVSNEAETENEAEGGFAPPQGMGGFGNKGQMMGMDSDFSVVGYSSENAMTDFVNGVASVTDGEVFDIESGEFRCLISKELADYNSLSVGDTIALCNPNNEEEIYEATVCGIYSNSSANEQSFSMMGATSADPANRIYMSYTAVSSMVLSSAETSETVTDDETGREYETGLSGQLSAVYCFASVEDYNAFEAQARERGLAEEYTVSSSDLTQFENSLAPLNTLSTMAGYFLLVILIIGAVILVVLNILTIRERKYEIGVLTAMGMKKGKVALQFLCEIFVVTLAAVIIGTAIGGVSALPVTNALLENQISQQAGRQNDIEQSFGRGDMMMPDNQNAQPPEMPSGMGGKFESFMQSGVEYVSEINEAMNFTVIAQLLLIAVGLTLAAGAVSMLFVMRYDPLKILANRD